MRRRELLALVGIAVALPRRDARAQQKAMPLVGLLSPREAEENLGAFRRGLDELGYIEGRNIAIAARSADSDYRRLPALAAELVALKPNVIVTNSAPAIRAVKEADGAMPIVMAIVDDPVALGFAQSLAHPGGNLTGFADYQFSMGGYWMAVLKEAAPRVKRVLVIFAPGDFGQEGLLRAASDVAARVGVKIVPAAVLTASELEKEINAFAREPNGGIIALPGDPSRVHRDVITTLAARHRLPAIYGDRYAIARGGLMSYDADVVDLYRRAAFYVDRLLKGVKPSELPVQLPTRYDLAVNLKAAKALGLTIPLWFLTTADEVIE